MENRRDFIRSSVAGFVGVSLLAGQNANASPVEGESFVKQLEETQTYTIRENTLLTIAISKTHDNVGGVSLCFEELTPGVVIPMHKHLHSDEFFHFISGSGVIIIEDKEFQFKAGTVGYVPRGMWHSIKNTGSDKAFFTFGYSPAGFEDFFKEIGTPQGQEFKAKSAEQLSAIAVKYGMVFKK